MPLKFPCRCGNILSAPFGSGGRKIRCPDCHLLLTIPEDPIETVDASPQPSTQAAPLSENLVYPPAPIVPTLAARSPGFKKYAYFLLLLAFLPLIIFTFQSHTDLFQRAERTITAHPEDPALQRSIADWEQHAEDGEATRADLFEMLPGHRLDGALLSYESKTHWLFALLAAAIFLGVILLTIPRASRFTKGMLVAGLFTSTFGIMLLLGFQWAAYFSSAMPLFYGGKAAIFILLLKLIGFSYSIADDPNSNVFISFIGFTCGVGLCEEITKLLPLLYRLKPLPLEENATWNTLLIWGLASGAGFGIAEGIMYSGRYYNGSGALDIYLVRFISCVALHAIWAGSAGIILYQQRASLQNAPNKWSYCFNVILIVLIPMTLHGLYDTLLTKEFDAFALLVALASFALLAYLIETMRRREPQAQLSA